MFLGRNREPKALADGSSPTERPRAQKKKGKWEEEKDWEIAQ